MSVPRPLTYRAVKGSLRSASGKPLTALGPNQPAEMFTKSAKTGRLV